MAERQPPFNSDAAAEASFGPGGTDLVPRRRPRINARLTAAGGGGYFSWVEVEEDDSGPNGWREVEGGLSGVYGDDDRAREVNGLSTMYADPTDGTVVELRPEPTADGWVFDGGTPGPPGSGGCEGCEDVTITYTNVDFVYNNVTVTIVGPMVIGGDTLIINAPVVIGYGLAWCGWWWICPESFVVSGAVIDPSTADPHMLERLTPSTDGVVLPGITPVAGPDGTQALLLTNIHAADSLILSGAAWWLPGADQLPLKLHAGDGCLTWYDGVSAVWRVIGTSYGDFRFHASLALTVAIFDENRELYYVPEGDVGDVLTQTETGPQWQPPPAAPGDWSITHYKTDCAGGFNVRSVRTATMTSGVFDAGVWEPESVQGCCECDEPVSGPCCFITPADHTLCITFYGALAALGTVELPWNMANAWAGTGPSLACTGVGTKSIELTCIDGHWDLDITSCDPPEVVVLSCDPLLLNVSGSGCISPCEGDWTAVIEEASSGGCGGSGEPPPPECCADVPVSVTAGDDFPLTLIPGVECVYGFSSSVSSVQSITVSTLAFDGYYHCTIALSTGATCSYSRAEADGCLGEYGIAFEAGCAVTFPSTVTVNG